ncbi:hypothetical protein ACQP3L_38005, partial [Escherichia coli]
FMVGNQTQGFMHTRQSLVLLHPKGTSSLAHRQCPVHMPNNELWASSFPGFSNHFNTPWPQKLGQEHNKVK